jgi:hypothetical protein
MIVVDEAADDEQRAALLQFVKSQAVAATLDIAAIEAATINMDLDIV